MYYMNSIFHENRKVKKNLWFEPCGLSHALSGLAINLALLYAISKVRQVCPKY